MEEATDEAFKKITNVNFTDDEFWKEWKGKGSNYEALEKMIIVLGICHTIVVEKKNGDL